MEVAEVNLRVSVGVRRDKSILSSDTSLPARLTGRLDWRLINPLPVAAKKKDDVFDR
jgi:hypothetical protein